MITVINSKTGNFLSVVNMLKKISQESILTEAIKVLNFDPYPSKLKLKKNKDYFLKKMNWTGTKLDEYINRQSKLHEEYPNSKFLHNNLLRFYKLYKK